MQSPAVMAIGGVANLNGSFIPDDNVGRGVGSSQCTGHWTLDDAHSTLLNNSESIWPTPFSTGVYQNEEPSPEGQRDKK